MDKQFIKRCIELAALGIGKVAPNPMVGAVLVHNNKIIGEGYHQHYGSKHAEVNAIHAVPEDLKPYIFQSTLYINLSPCSNHGKTPPCVDLIMKYKIPRIVIGCLDPNPQMQGGEKILKKQGCEVITNVLKKECTALNTRFFTFHQQRRPYIILKWAQTKDGFIAKQDHSSKWISNEWSRKLVHKWRSEEMSIMVGTNTIQHDNPELTVRNWQGNNPVRIVLDKNLSLDKSLHVYNNKVHTIVFTSKKENNTKNITYFQIDFQKNIIPQILKLLYENSIQSVMIEGGRHLLTSFIEANLWDEARIFTSNQTFKKGIAAPRVDGVLISKENIVGDELLIYSPKK